MNEKEKELLHNNHNGIKLLGSLGIGITGFLGMLVSPAIGLPAIAYGTLKAQKYATGNYIKHSSFGVRKNYKGFKNYINMNIENPLQLLNTVLSNDKQEALNIQLLNFFNQLDSNDKSGKTINYTATTHTCILKKLYALQRQGFIEGIPPLSQLSKNTGGKKNLLAEKLLLGNIEGLKQELKNIPTTLYHRFIMKNKNISELQKNGYKPVQFYDIRFNLTGKKFTQEDAIELLKTADCRNYEIKTNKDGTLKFIKPKTLTLIKNLAVSKSQKLFPNKDKTLLLSEHSTSHCGGKSKEEINNELIATIRGNASVNKISPNHHSCLHERIQNISQEKTI